MPSAVAVPRQGVCNPCLSTPFNLFSSPFLIPSPVALFLFLPSLDRTPAFFLIHNHWAPACLLRPRRHSRLPPTAPPSYQSAISSLLCGILPFYDLDIGKRQASLSDLGKLVMQNQFGVASSQLSSSPTSSEPEQSLAVQPPSSFPRNGVLYSSPVPAPVAIPTMASAVKMMKDLTDSPPLSQSVNSTASSSPRM